MFAILLLPSDKAARARVGKEFCQLEGCDNGALHSLSLSLSGLSSVFANVRGQKGKF